ncbi:MAG: glycoside hydrolase family 113 [Anaerolineae bacterium]
MVKDKGSRQGWLDYVCYTFQRSATSVLLCIGLLWLVLAPKARAHEPLAGQANPTFQKGISYAAWWSGVYRTQGAEVALQALRATGANWIALIVTGHQDGIAATTIDRTHPSTPTDEDLIHAINLAHSMGLKVMLKPHVDLFNEVPGGPWRGDIGKAFTTEAQWAAWFNAYREFINHYAALAQTHGVEQFCIGTELLGTTHRADDWRAVAAGVRAIYKGPIVYAALKEGEETSITWWDTVDYIGVDGYYPLNTNPGVHPTVEQLEAAWARPKTILAELSAKYRKPILLTEIGYRSRQGCTAKPWDSWETSQLDMEEQANAYEAAFRQLFKEPWLAGMFWWMWSADPFESGPCDMGYTPAEKPAEDILRRWYGAPPRPVEPIRVPDYTTQLPIYNATLASNWQNWSWGISTLEMGAAQLSPEGTPSIALTVQPYGALSLWHSSPHDMSPYYWLEFYVRSANSTSPRLTVFLSDENGTEGLRVPVNDCRHISGGNITTEWKLARLRLSDLNRLGKRITRVSIQEGGGQNASLYLANLRFVAAKDPHQIMLPVIAR